MRPRRSNSFENHQPDSLPLIVPLGVILAARLHERVFALAFKVSEPAFRVLLLVRRSLARGRLVHRQARFRTWTKMSPVAGGHRTGRVSFLFACHGSQLGAGRFTEPAPGSPFLDPNRIGQP